VGLCIAFLAALTAWAEYQTNLGARAMGRFMAATNGWRRPGGTVGTRLDAQRLTMASLDTVTVDVDRPTGELPPTVAGARFELDRTMQGELPDFIAIYRVPLSETDRRRREGPEVLSSLAAYRLGLAILRSASFPESRYARRVAREIEAIYRVSDLPDTAAAEVQDSLEAAYRDSFEAGLRDLLAGDEIERLRDEDRERLAADFRAGRVYSVVIEWGLGRYEGEVSYVDPAIPRVAFELPLWDLAQIPGAAERPNPPAPFPKREGGGNPSPGDSP
jgi:hypothetical protein